MKEIFDSVRRYNISTVIFDIDGTIRDLASEHSNSLMSTLRDINGRRISKKLVIYIDKIAMCIIKLGVLPTNVKMQRMLLYIYSLLLVYSYKKLRDEYFKYYEDQSMFFRPMLEVIDELIKSSIDVKFVTANVYNELLERKEIFYGRINCNHKAKKCDVYKANMKVEPYKVLIVGDNLIDDIFSAKKLGTHYLLVNMYNNRIKAKICKKIKE